MNWAIDAFFAVITQPRQYLASAGINPAPAQIPLASMNTIYEFTAPSSKFFRARLKGSTAHRRSIPAHAPTRVQDHDQDSDLDRITSAGANRRVLAVYHDQDADLNRITFAIIYLQAHLGPPPCAHRHPLPTTQFHRKGQHHPALWLETLLRGHQSIAIYPNSPLANIIAASRTRTRHTPDPRPPHPSLPPFRPRPATAPTNPRTRPDPDPIKPGQPAKPGSFLNTPSSLAPEGQGGLSHSVAASDHFVATVAGDITSDTRSPRPPPLNSAFLRPPTPDPHALPATQLPRITFAVTPLVQALRNLTDTTATAPPGALADALTLTLAVTAAVGTHTKQGKSRIIVTATHSPLATTRMRASVASTAPRPRASPFQGHSHQLARTHGKRTGRLHDQDSDLDRITFAVTYLPPRFGRLDV
ncbi:hypothetical protein FB451DRAFT_1561598 [Mycena latifolia]|nr:hypothetical protein FB451DRAFT_1561598 [Mycena latifolia]